jgi:hypothetical protein
MTRTKYITARVSLSVGAKHGIAVETRCEPTATKSVKLTPSGDKSHSADEEIAALYGTKMFTTAHLWTLS